MLEIKTADELITPELEAEWAARRSARRSPVLQHIVRAFLAVGGPVSVEAVEAALPGHDRDAVREHLTALDAQDLIQLGAGGVEIAYPFSASPTPFVSGMKEEPSPRCITGRRDVKSDDFGNTQASRARRDPGGNARCVMPLSVAAGCLRYGGGAGTGVLGEHAGWAGR